MQYVGRLVSSVYNNITPSINPATLSGAIDVIVVERQVEIEVDDDQDQDQGQEPSAHLASSNAEKDSNDWNQKDKKPKKKKKKLVTELASTPFHVRFGKMSVLRPAERKVTLHLNNSPDPLPFAMKVGEAGEAFFVLELDDSSYGNESIPEDLVTSPILSAASSPTLSAKGGQEGKNLQRGKGKDFPFERSEDENQDDSETVERKQDDDFLEPLDLGAAKSSGPSLTKGTGNDQAQHQSPEQQEEAEESDARSGTTDLRSRSSRSRSQDTLETNLTSPTSGGERSLSPDSKPRDIANSRHSRAKGYDNETSVPSKVQSDPNSNTADQTGPLSSLSNAASKASGVVSAAGRAIMSPVTSNPDPTADGSKNSKLESLVSKSQGGKSNDKAPIEEEDEEMKSNWNTKSTEGQKNGGITKGAKKQDKEDENRERKRDSKGENLVERNEAEELEFQMQKRALNLVRAEQETTSPSDQDERAPSSSLAQIQDSKSEHKDDDQPISNALLAEESFPRPFGTSSSSTSEQNQTHPIPPPTASKGKQSQKDQDEEELKSYLGSDNSSRNPISSLSTSDSIPPKTQTYPVSQPDHEKYLAGTSLGKEKFQLENGQVKEFDKVKLDPRVIRRKIENEKQETGRKEGDKEKDRADEDRKEEERRLSKSPKIERREELQYMLDIDGYKMTADGEDLAFAEGHRFANEMPLSKKHGGNGKHKKVTRYEDSALVDDDDDAEPLESGKGKSRHRTSFARSSRSAFSHGHRTSRSMSRNRNGRSGSTSLTSKEGNSARRDFKNSLSGSSAMGHHLQARLRTRRSSSSLLDDLTHELSSGDERPVLGLGSNDELGGTVEKESLSLSRDLARLARITRDHHSHHRNHSSRRNNVSEGNLTPTSLIARRRTRSTKISGGPLGAGPRNRAKNAASGGHFKEVSYSDTEAEVPALRQKARRSRGKNLRTGSPGLTLSKGKAGILIAGGDSSVPSTPSYTSFPKDDSQSFEADRNDRDDLEDGEKTPPAHPDSSMGNVNQSSQYEWGWGSLPKKKTQDEKERRARVVSLGEARAMRPEVENDDAAEAEVASYDAAATSTSTTEEEDRESSIDAINKANEKAPNGKLRSDDSDPYLFRLELDDASHKFELSLCFDDTFGTSDGIQDPDLVQERDDYNFEENKISFQRFVDDQEVVDDERLVVRYNSRYLTWESASAVLATLSLYRKTLSAAEMERNEASSAHNGSLDGEGPESQPRPSVWSRWWNRKGVSSGAQTESQDRDASKDKSSAPPAASPPHSLDRSRTDSILETSKLQEAGRPAGAAPSAERVAKDRANSKKTYAKTLRLTSDQLKSLNLKKGANTITFSVTSSYSGVATCTARIFFWESFHRVVVSDIDGTITKSDALGHVFTMMGRDWTHLGVAKLYTDIARNGYRIMYLTSRAIGQADSTRDYLKGIRQNNYQLPDGPVIMSPDRLMASLHREVILRKPEVFKMACLRDIARLFGADPRHAQAQPGGQWPGVSKESLKAASGIGAGGESSPAGGAATSGISSPSPSSSQDSKTSLNSPSASNPTLNGSSKPQQPGPEQEEKEAPGSSQQANPTPFYAGFGNRITDALSYRSVNIPSSRIFTIDSNGEVKMELLELAGYKSSYIHMTDLVDQMFPPITSRQEQNPDKPEYNDFNFWRPSVMDIELPADEDLIPSPPVSPALSARSGRSMKSVRSNASLRSATSDSKDSDYGHGRSQTEVTETATTSSSRLSRFGLGSLGLSRKASSQTVANVPASSRPTSSSSTNSSTSVLTFPTGASSSTSYDAAIPASNSAPDLTDTWTAASNANGEDSTSSSPPSSYGRGVTSWAAPWRRSRATSPSGTSISGVGLGNQHRQATSPLVGPVITAEPEEDDDLAALSDDDVSNFGGDREGNLDGKVEEEGEREGSEDMGDDVLDQDEEGDEEEEDEEEDDDDPLLATGDIRFEWRG